MQNIQSKASVKGLSLVEVLVALGVGALLLGGAMGMLIGNKRVYNEQTMMSRLQEDMRWTVDTMLYDIRMAGFLGCADDPAAVTNNIAPTGGWASLVTNPVTPAPAANNIILEGMEGNANPVTWLPGGGVEGINTALANTDGISMRFMEALPGTPTPTLDAPMAGTAAAISVNNIAGLAVFDTLALADCQSADVFMVTGLAGGDIQHGLQAANTQADAGNTTVNLGQAYGMDANLYRYRARRYLIQNQNVAVQGAGVVAIPTLFRWEFNIDAQDIDADGSTVDRFFLQTPLATVDNMQLAYLSQGGNAFVTADNVANWELVVAVRLALLFSTAQQDFHLPADNTQYNLLNNVVAAANDNRLRRVFTTTVQIRNN